MHSGLLRGRAGNSRMMKLIDVFTSVEVCTCHDGPLGFSSCSFRAVLYITSHTRPGRILKAQAGCNYRTRSHLSVQKQRSEGLTQARSRLNVYFLSFQCLRRTK